MSLTSYSKVATLGRVNRAELAIELLITGIKCEYPRCSDQAFAVAESGVSMFMCETHYGVWSDSKEAKRIIESARLAELTEEIWRTVSAAYEDPGEVIFWNANRPLVEDVFDGAESVIESFLRRKTVAPAPSTTQIIEPKANSNSTLQSLGPANSYDLLMPPFL